MSVMRKDLFWLRPDLLSVRDVARRLGLGQRTVWRLLAAGELPQPVRFGPSGRIVRWKAAEIDHYVKQMRPRV
jgi:excisionase family DNA binding protein